MIHRLLTVLAFAWLALPAPAQDGVSRPPDAAAELVTDQDGAPEPEAGTSEGEAPADGAGPALEIAAPDLVLRGIPFEATIVALDADGEVDAGFAGVVTLDGARRHGAEDGAESTVEFTAEDAGSVAVDLVVVAAGRVNVTATGVGRTGEIEPRSIPAWWSIVPPLLAIAMAILLRQVVAALVLGVLIGALFLVDLNPARMLLAFADTHVLSALYDEDHLKIILFTLLLGGMVGVISRSGGTYGIVNLLTKRATTRRSGQLASAGLGSAIFFDDYANCLIAGNTMRPLTDRLRISREKLAYIVDSTAAPVASLIPLSTWVGYQVGLVKGSIEQLPGGYPDSAYWLIIQSIPYMFYPIFALLLVYAVAWFDRDSFTMLGAERRALREGKVLRDGAEPMAAAEGDSDIQAKEGAPQRAFNALIPILGVVVVTIVGLAYTGWSSRLETDGFVAQVRAVIGDADPYTPLLWAAMTGVTLAVLLAAGQRILSVNEAVTSAVNGMRSMLLAIIILVLSWSLANVAEALHTNAFLVAQLDEGLAVGWLPMIVFLLAAATAFATGTSWGTMGILTPIVVPLVLTMGAAEGLSAEALHVVLLGSIASVLGGSVFGDHCSPISDTTVLSSTATSCDHIDHVRTQIPYALLAAAFAAAAGFVPAVYGISVWLTLPAGILLMIVMVRTLFRPVGTPAVVGLADVPEDPADVA